MSLKQFSMLSTTIISQSLAEIGSPTNFSTSAMHDHSPEFVSIDRVVPARTLALGSMALSEGCQGSIRQGKHT